MSASPVVLADGHHRYSVARRYRDEERAAHDGVSGAYDLVMALVVELEEEGLRVGPIHRALSGSTGPGGSARGRQGIVRGRRRRAQ